MSGHDCYAPDWIGHGASDKVPLLLAYICLSTFPGMSCAMTWLLVLLHVSDICCRAAWIFRV